MSNFFISERSKKTYPLPPFKLNRRSLTWCEKIICICFNIFNFISIQMLYVCMKWICGCVCVCSQVVVNCVKVISYCSSPTGKLVEEMNFIHSIIRLRERVLFLSPLFFLKDCIFYPESKSFTTSRSFIHFIEVIL